MTPSKQNPPKWINSPAKACLINLLTKEEIPSEMKPKAVYEKFCKHRPEFSVFKDNNFGSRLKALRDKVKDRNNRAVRDEAAFRHDRLIYPRPCQDGFGLPHWPDSEAKELLNQDIDQGKHLILSKEDLWKSKPEYWECFPFEIFVKHVHQEIKTRKFHQYVADKRENKIAKTVLDNMPFSSQSETSKSSNINGLL